MAEVETYNFGVLTKRFQLAGRSMAQYAPAVVGMIVGGAMVVTRFPVPLPLVPVLVGGWFSLGSVPFGRFKGTPVRSLVVPFVRYARLTLGGETRWEAPGTWLTVTQKLSLDPVEPTPTRRSSRRTRWSPARPDKREPLPPELGRLRWRTTTYGGAEAGLLAERAGRGHVLTAVLAVYGGDRFVFSSPDEQAAQVARWGTVLAGMAGEGRGLRRLQWVERATPQPSTVQADWARSAMVGVGDEEWGDYVSLMEAIGTAAIRHDVYLGAQVEADATKEDDAIGEATPELAQLCEHLTSIGLRPRPLSCRGIAAVLRQWADPTAAERLSIWGEGSIPPAQGGPASRLVTYDTCRTDGYYHRIGRIAAWPRVEVGPDWMYPLLAAAVPGSVRTVSMHLEAVSTEVAFQEVRESRTTGAMAQDRRDRKDLLTTEEERRRTDEARTREAELTRGYRQHKIGGLVMVSSPDRETVDRAWRHAERKAIECHLDLRETHAQGHAAWAATLPICRLRFSHGWL